MFKADSLALVSHGAVWGRDELTSARLKVATLLFDRLLFVGSGMDKAADFILSEDASKETISTSARHSLRECWRDTEGLAPHFSIYGPGPGMTKWPWAIAPDQLKEATRAVLEKLYAHGATEENGYEAYKYGGYLMSEIIYWSEYFRNASFIGDTATEDVLKLIRFSSIDKKDEGPKWSETTLPDIDSISWNDIAGLRKSPFLTAFRQKYAELSVSGEAERVFELYFEALERLADAAKPRLATTIVSGGDW